MKKIPENNNEDVFEAELFHSLKSYGYLFPENVSEVEAFEELFGTQMTDTPSIQNVLAADTKSSSVDIFDLEDMSLAAYSNLDDQFPELPDEDLIKPKNDEQL
jgi:hypothetical protein